jgi:HTH-type transcriptional regulator/antitoxin HigA
MITNDRQYKISKTVLRQFQEAIQNFDLEEAKAEVGGDKVLAEAQLRALESEFEIVSEQIKEYEALRLGVVGRLVADSLSDLPLLLIKARIANGYSQRELAEKLGLKEQQIQRYEAEKYASASLRRLVEISDCLGLKISESARIEALKDEKTASAKTSSLILDNLDKFPLKEMYRRGWFDDFYGSIRDAETNAKYLIEDFFKIIGGQPMKAFHKKKVRTGSALDEYSLFAWQCRILKLARDENIKTSFKKSRISKVWIQELAKLSAKDNSPRLAKEYLQSAGIALIVEPHLPQTYLDGAALLLSEEIPVIGMTLRFDRLDNFWFVLFHELAHLILHLDKNHSEFFDDMDGKPDEIEKEADEFACEALIPNEIWETSIARYLRSEDSVNDLATQLKVSPALVAGRIRRESENYLMLNKLVGAGEVRNQFTEVKFGV